MAAIKTTCDTMLQRGVMQQHARAKFGFDNFSITTLFEQEVGCPQRDMRRGVKASALRAKA